MAGRHVPRADRGRQPGRADQGQARRRRDHQPDDLRLRPSPTASATTTRCASSSRTAPTSRGDLRGRPPGRPQRLRRHAPRLRGHRRPTAGSPSRWRPTWRTTPRPPSTRPGSCGGPSTGRTCYIKIPATERGAARHHGDDRPGHQRQRDADLQRGALPRGHGRLPDRSRAGPRRGTRPRQDLLGRLVLRLPGRHRGGQAARRRGGSDEAKACAARRRSPTRCWPTRRTRRCWRATAGSSSRTPAPTRSGRCGPRPGSRTPTTPTPSTSTDLVVADTVNTMPEKTLDAFADHGEVKGDLVTGKAAEAPRRSSTSSTPSGSTCHDVFRVAGGGGRGQVQEVVGRAGRDRREADGAGHPVTDWNTVKGSSYELFFGYPDEDGVLLGGRAAGRRQGGQRLAARTPPCGARRLSPRRPSGCPGSAPRDLARRWSATWLLWTPAAGARADPGRAVRHGWVVAGARGDL